MVDVELTIYRDNNRAPTFSSEIRSNSFIEGSNYSLESSYKKCPVKDIYINENKSWLLLAGIPFIDGNNYADNLDLQAVLENLEEFINTRVDGHFCCLAYNDQSQTFYVASDCNSFIPIFYGRHGNLLIFSTNLEQLCQKIRPTISSVSFSRVIQLGSPLPGETQFNNIHRLEANQLLKVPSDLKIEKKYYWTPSDEKEWSLGFNDTVDKWLDILNKSVSPFVQVASENNLSLSADITGGEDSRLIVAELASLNTSFSTRVRGLPEDADINIGRAASNSIKKQIDIEHLKMATTDEIRKFYIDICLLTRGYGSFFSSLTKFASDNYYGVREKTGIHLAGVPGGEAFRGSYYLRAKILSPSSHGSWDYKFLLKLKFLLDYIPNLISRHDDFTEQFYSAMACELNKVKEFSNGIQVDHLLKIMQTDNWSLEFNQPFNMPLGMRDITRSIYCIPAKYKLGGKLTRSCTELLCPTIANINTSKGIPTIQKHAYNFWKFAPEYFAVATKIVNGFKRRLLKLQQNSTSLSMHHRSDIFESSMACIFNDSNMAKWFSSPLTMITGEVYNQDVLKRLLDDSRLGNCSHVRTLGRIINQEIFIRHVTKHNQ